MIYGYRSGERVLVRAQVDSGTSALSAGDILSAGTAGYVQQAAAGDVPVGICLEVASAPSADGGKTVLMDVSTESLYEFPPDAGSVTQALCNTTVDIGGPQSINIDATSDKVFVVREVDLVANTCLGHFLFSAAAR